MSNKRVNPFKLKLHLLECEADEKDKKISDLEAKLAKSEKLTERLQQIVDKLRDKEFAGKTLVEAVNAVYEPLYKNKYDEAEELKQQLHELPKKIVSEIKDCLLDVSNGWWRYFMTDGCEYMLSSDLQGCLDETIDTILKKYGGEK